MNSAEHKDKRLKNGSQDRSTDSGPTVEDLFERLGGYSWFQLLATVLIISPEVPAAMLAMLPVIIGRSTIVGDETATRGRNNTAESQGYFQHTSIADEFGLYGDRAWLVDSLTSVQMIGCTAGVLFCSLWADKYGRKKVFYSVVALMGVSGIASGCAFDVISYAVARFFVGVAVGGMYVHYLIYLMEFLTPSFRIICGCISFWALGEMFLALIGYLVPQWRILTWIISLPALALIITFPWLPESPRFLLCKGRTQEAIKVFNQIAKLNKRKEVDADEVRWLQAFMLAQIDDGHAKSKKDNGSPTGSTRTGTIISAITSSARHRKHLMIFALAWFTCSIVYYGLSFNTKNLDGNVYLNVFWLGVTDLPGHMSGILFNNRFGRKTSLNIFLSLGTCFFIGLAMLEYFELSKWSPSLLIAVSLFGRYCISASWAIVACFTSESFPTSIRAFCMGLCAFTANIGGVLSPYMGLLGSAWASGPYIVMSTLSAIVIVCTIGLEEAVQKPLQDVVVANA